MKNKKQQLGRALIKDRFLKQPNQFINDDGLFRNNFVTIVSEDTSSSITQQNDIEQFIHTAILSNRDFTALRNASIVSTDTEQKTEIDLEKFKDQLTIPKRPEWDSTTTKEELHEKEQLEFLEWRRSLVYLEEEKQLLLTPFERNLQVWRQLWRVVERSELLVEIVDARNPLFFRSVDLQKYVVRKSVHLLLVNKADLLSREQRLKWAQYFKKEGIDFLFFSAHMAKELLEQEELGVDQYGQQRVLEQVASLVVEDDTPKEARILNAGELLSTLKEKCPVSDKEKRTIGFVGYPNVGKSSTLNALIGSTKVAVGATPGKTKHFQTIHLEDIVLCDCPGLVFPSFASTKAEMVVCGVLPIDQLRDHIQPTELVCQRIPKWYLESVYGIVIKTRDVDGTLVDRQPTAEELLTTYASILV
jgi:large subunit GTPase 1